MHWYEDLKRYFPAEEMRLRAHFAWLMDHRPEIYRVDAGSEYLLLLIEYDDVSFIDYLYVYPEHRGQGVGSRVLQSLKAKGKPVLLEAEPPSAEDPDSWGRRRFYDREGFRPSTPRFTGGPIRRSKHAYAGAGRGGRWPPSGF